MANASTAPASVSLDDAIRIRADAARRLALARGLDDFSTARKIVDADLVRYCGQDVAKVLFSRENLERVRAKVAQSVADLRRWAAEQDLDFSVIESEWQRTVLMPGEFRGAPRVYPTDADRKAAAAANDSKHDAAYKSAMAANPGVYAGKK